MNGKMILVGALLCGSVWNASGEAYVQSQGDSYVETDYYPNKDTRIEVDFQFVDVSTTQPRVFGTESTAFSATVYINSVGKYAFSINDGRVNGTSTVDKDTARHTAIVDACSGAALTAFAASANEVTSEATFVWLRPETSSFWHTATNRTLRVPIDLPAGASSATLTVEGIGYKRTYAGLTGADFTLELPAATSPATENVYTLTLAFDEGTVRTARLGLVQSYAAGAEATTRCLVPAGGRAWRKAKNHAVVPVPYGATALTVNGVEVETGLDGAQGWFALASEPGEGYALSLVTSGLTYAASLVGKGDGSLIIVK